MINKLWTGVSLENYNNWYPLTGKITETPQQYIQTWPNVNDWFITFAIRAQNDINAYLDFILSKFPFDSFKDELIKETLRDMVYVMVEHWVFNRTPIEFNVDATIQFNNGNQFSASSIPTINIWDLAPSRMKIWARLTELKQIFSSYNDHEIDVEKIDLKAFYTRNQVDELIKEQKEFTLLKQIKLYDDLVDDNENEVYRGPVTNFINKGYVATDYNKETETMILDWPDEIGTLPPEALQNNPQIGDFTHAPTCDFSAKQQKRITTNENEITKLNSELTKTNENIDDIKNNWFNIETSPLWKKVENNNIEMLKWYFIKISYHYSTENNFMKFYKIIKIYLNNIFHEFELLNVDSMTYKEQIQNKNILNIGTIYYDNRNKKFRGGGNSYPERGKINLIGDIEEIYQYQGINTPTEFIAEENTEHDYYTKLETNNLLDKKQNKLIAGTNITIDENNKISASGGSSVDENRIFNNKDDKENTTRLVNEVIKTNVGGKTLIYRNNPVITDDLDIPNKKYIDDKIPNLDNYYIKTEVDKKLEDTKAQFPIAFQINAVSQEIPNLETTNKTVVGSINENKSNIDKKQDKEVWKIIGKSLDNRTWEDFALSFNKYYRVFITWDKPPFNQTSVKLKIEFKSSNYIGGNYMLVKGKIDNEDASLIIKLGTVDGNKSQLIIIGGNKQFGNIFSLEELQDTIKIDIQPKLQIRSGSLTTNEIEENIWDIELKNNPTPSPSFMSRVAKFNEQEQSAELFLWMNKVIMVV
ncbi:hypothetical protein [Spiroplasma endosymbiont of Danaus chrysippus]|uniref:hypothetical protein n=1 Tax=Spiroplasma endosymbiont of Danaus chrysippus TaxID=2691041 RepID=UPI0013C69D6F|nr:hypothetical protein [Spiroplasma endosymbiont of Danaus chrysippus]CAB1054056.1 hypothetical protein [Spiroplasma endosymbiont of Danaus chrysippus]